MGPENTMNLVFALVILAFSRTQALTVPDQMATSTDHLFRREIPYDSHKFLQKDFTNPQTQSFNVGYSVSFTNGAGQKKPVQPKLMEDIITGSNKEKVLKPSATNSEEFVLNPYLDLKKQKFTGIKPKYPRPSSNSNNINNLIAQANLSPKTQKFLQNLEPTRVTTTKSPWKSLSGNVEIYKSHEVSSSHNYGIQTPYKFDHQKAIGRSEGFDYTNALEAAKMSFNQQNQFGQEKFGQNIENQHVPKLPIDTSLLRDPVLTENMKQVPGNDKIIPIRFDTRLVHAMGNKILGFAQPQQHNNVFGPNQKEIRVTMDDVKHLVQGQGHQSQDLYKVQENLEAQYRGLEQTQFKSAGPPQYKGIQPQYKEYQFGSQYRDVEPQFHQFGGENQFQKFGSLDDILGQHSQVSEVYGHPQALDFGGQSYNFKNCNHHQLKGGYQGKSRATKHLAMEYDLRPPPMPIHNARKFVYPQNNYN